MITNYLPITIKDYYALKIKLYNIFIYSAAKVSIVTQERVMRG